MRSEFVKSPLVEVNTIEVCMGYIKALIKVGQSPLHASDSAPANTVPLLAAVYFSRASLYQTTGVTSENIVILFQVYILFFLILGSQRGKYLTPFSQVVVNRCFGGTYCVHLQIVSQANE
jgi:hypothetical protein